MCCPFYVSQQSTLSGSCRSNYRHNFVKKKMSNFSQFSLSPLLLCPGKIVKLSIFSLLSPRNCSICLMNVSSWIFNSTLFIAVSSSSSSVNPSKNSEKVASKLSVISKPALSKKSAAKGYFSSKSF